MEEKDISKEMMAGDEPIRNEDEDLLGWGEYARLIANAVGNPTSEASMVYAINGAWGSGKSSLLNLVEQEIVKAQADNANENGRKTVIVHFEPWNCVDQNGIIRSFFDAFESVLSLWHDKNKLAQVVFGAGKVANAAGKIMQLIPAVSSLAPIFLKAGNLLSNYRKSLLEGMNNLESRKKELERYLAEQEKIRFLFIIDDLDRLNVSEMRLLMQLMKSVCNFRNVSYLLAFDRRIVARALDGEQTSGEGSGESYLSKIVQTTIDVPGLSSDKAQEVCEKCLKRLFAEHGEKAIKIAYPIPYLVSFFKSLRSIKRYLREMAFALDEFRGDIDPLDLATLIAVKCLDRKAHELYIKYKPYLLGLQSSDDDKKNFESQYAQTFIGKHDDIVFGRVYAYLFPHAFESLPDRDKLISNRHIYNPEVFETYLKTVPTIGKISYYDAMSILSLNNDDFLKACLKYESTNLESLIKAKINILTRSEDGYVGVAELLTDLSNRGAKQSPVCDWFITFLCLKPKLEKVLPAFINELEKTTNFPTAYSIYWYLNLFFKENGLKNKPDVNCALKKHKDFIVTNLIRTPYSIFDVIDDSFKSLVEETDEVSAFIDASNDPQFLKKLFITSESVNGDCDQKHYGITSLISKKLKLFAPYLDNWIAESQSQSELAAFVVCKMLISGLKPDYDYGEDGCSFSMKRISEYTKMHYPDKTAILRGETVSKP